MAEIGGPLAAAQRIEKLFTKPNLGCPNGPIPPENSSIQEEGAIPPTSLDAFSGGKGPVRTLTSDVEKNVSMGWVAAMGPPKVGKWTRVTQGADHGKGTEQRTDSKAKSAMHSRSHILHTICM